MRVKLLDGRGNFISRGTKVCFGQQLGALPLFDSFVCGFSFVESLRAPRVNQIASHVVFEPDNSKVAVTEVPFVVTWFSTRLIFFEVNVAWQ